MAKDKRPKAAAPQSKQQPSSAVNPAVNSAPPDWPAFKPPLPVVDLEFESLVESKVVVLRSFFPKNLCRDYVSFLRTLPLITTPGKPKRGDAVRVNDRFQIQDARFADRLWSETGLKDAILRDEVSHLWGGEVIGLNPNIRIYRYSKGQFFDAHSKTTWTLLLYLTSQAEGCVGGETVFYPHDRRLAREEIPVSLETGMLLLHKHGDDCMLHEGKEVKAGEKWVIRTDLCVVRK